MSSSPLLTAWQNKLSSEEIAALPLFFWQGSVQLIRDMPSCARACEELMCCDLIGFDTESRPAFRKGQSFLPSVLQLATAEVAYLFQLSVLGFPDCVRAVLASPECIKTGVATADDVSGLQKIQDFSPDNFIDLGQQARKLKLQTHGLRNLAAKFLGVRISKGARCSNWAQKKLSSRQQRYAATDAVVSRELYIVMKEHGLL